MVEAVRAEDPAPEETVVPEEGVAPMRAGMRASMRASSSSAMLRSGTLSDDFY